VSLGIALVDRQSILQEILRIEAEIRTIRRNPEHVRIKHNLDKLEKRRFGSRTVSVQSPDDPDKTMEVRVNSQEMLEITSRYRRMRTEFDVQVGELLAQKERLQKQLYA